MFITERIGMHGRAFNCYKFRTMKDFGVNKSRNIQDYVDSLPNQKRLPLETLVEDPRITLIGKLLRMTGLDESPQLYNILKGDMSFVGPRAGLRFEADEYQDRYEPLLKCRPGLTGLSQLDKRYLEIDDMIDMDTDYIHRMSFWLDVKICLRTFESVIRRRRAS